jgi:hypothetical protein
LRAEPFGMVLGGDDRPARGLQDGGMVAHESSSEDSLYRTG